MEVGDLKLVKFEFSERVRERLNWEIEKFDIGDLKILLGDNAQGKTRIFNVLRFIKDIHIGTRTINNPDYYNKYKLWFREGDDEITYYIEMKGDISGTGLTFNEKVIRNERILFDREKKILIEEGSGQRIEKFLLPANLPVVRSASDPGYLTFNAIRSFFERMLFLEANRFEPREIAIDRNAMVVNAKGSNIGCVMANWKERMPFIYEEIISSFQNCYPFITQFFVREEQLFDKGLTLPLLFIREKNVEQEIDQKDWSDGLVRALSLFALPCTQFQRPDKEPLRPSLIGVDEIENGLDFNALGKVISHYESYSNLVQILIATHSPLVCNMIDPKNWLIVRRKGARVEVISPSQVEDLDSERERLRKDNWEFYRRHISGSNLYGMK